MSCPCRALASNMLANFLRRCVCAQMCCTKLLIERVVFLPHCSHVVSAAAWGWTSISYAKRAARWEEPSFILDFFFLCWSVALSLCSFWAGWTFLYLCLTMWVFSTSCIEGFTSYDTAISLTQHIIRRKNRQEWKERWRSDHNKNIFLASIHPSI